MSKICCQIAVKARNVSNSNRLKPLVEVLEQSRGLSKKLGLPKGGFDKIRRPASHESSLFLASCPCHTSTFDQIQQN